MAKKKEDPESLQTFKYYSRFDKKFRIVSWDFHSLYAKLQGMVFDLTPSQIEIYQHIHENETCNLDALKRFTSNKETFEEDLQRLAKVGLIVVNESFATATKDYAWEGNRGWLREQGAEIVFKPLSKEHILLEQ